MNVVVHLCLKICDLKPTNYLEPLLHSKESVSLFFQLVVLLQPYAKFSTFFFFCKSNTYRKKKFIVLHLFADQANNLIEAFCQMLFLFLNEQMLDGHHNIF